MNDLLGDYGAILQDATDPSLIAHGCASPAAEFLRMSLERELMMISQKTVSPHLSRYAGCLASLSIPAALSLEAQGASSPELATAIEDMISVWRTDWSQCQFSAGQSCIDAWVCQASGKAWTSAWLAFHANGKGGIGRIGAVVREAQTAVRNALKLSSMSDATASICFLRRNGFCADYPEPGILLSDLSTGAVQAAVFRHRIAPSPGQSLRSFENPNYGIGIIPLIASTFLALDAAGQDGDFHPDPEDPLFRSGDRWAVLVLQELYREGQRHTVAIPGVRITQTGSTPTQQAWQFAEDCAWWGLPGESTEPHAPCWDASICQGEKGPVWSPVSKRWTCPKGITYAPAMYPVLEFMRRKGRMDDRSRLFPKLPDRDSSAFYPFDRFDSALFSPCAPFFHDGRVSIYRDLGWCWFWTRDEEMSSPEKVPLACRGHTRPPLGPRAVQNIK